MSENKAIVAGEIIYIGDVEYVGQKGTQKRIIAIREGDEYPQDVGIEFFGEAKVAMLEGYAVGDHAEVSYNRRGREYQGRYYVNLAAWKIDGNPSGASVHTDTSVHTDDGETRHNSAGSATGDSGLHDAANEAMGDSGKDQDSLSF